MSEINPEAVKTFSIGFAEREFNELDKARLVANHFNTEHHELIVEPDAVDILPKIVRHFGEPFADSSALPTYYVSKMARQYVKVALSGDGGDELFLGYTIFRGLEFARYAQKIPAPIRRALAAMAGSLPGIGKASWKDKLMRFKKQARDSILSPREAFYRKTTAGMLDAILPLISSGTQNHFVGQNPYREFDEQFEVWADPNAHPLEQFVYIGLKIPLVWDMLVKVDRMSMANSLEVRVPFLDHILAEFVSTIPLEQRFPYWRLKGLLRDTMVDLLPPEILNQPKHGFTVPLAAWFRGDLAAFAADVLLSQESRQSGFLDNVAIEKSLSKHKHGMQNLGREIWSLLIFELWRQQVMS
jgi:asparagine synthase (glutamine-hydrolysing)